MKMIYIKETSQPVVVSLEWAEKLLDSGKFVSYPDKVGVKQKELSEVQLAKYIEPKKKKKGRPKKEA